jgi:hypothetical protein
MADKGTPKEIIAEIIRKEQGYVVPEQPEITADEIIEALGDGGLELPPIWFCERKHQCKWQCFALNGGIAFGEIPIYRGDNSWFKWHEKECGGKLIQINTLIQPKVAALQAEILNLKKILEVGCQDKETHCIYQAENADLKEQLEASKKEIETIRQDPAGGILKVLQEHRTCCEYGLNVCLSDRKLDELKADYLKHGEG